MLTLLSTSPEVYDTELEWMNASLAAENQTLQHDNKQLGVLICEYEQTLESIMSAFRTRAVSCIIFPYAPFYTYLIHYQFADGHPLARCSRT